MNDNQNEYNIYESSKKRKKYFIGAILLVVFMGIGYAFLQTTLNISGTTKVSKNTWSIYWDNIQVKNGSVTGTQVTTVPTLSVNNTKVTFEVNLKQPGEYYEFTVDTVNNGTLDAMIEDIDFDVDNGGELPTYLDFKVTYEDDAPLLQKQILKAKDTNENVETYKVRVEFKKDITSTDLPSNENGETIVCTVAVSYVQADNTARGIRYYTSVSDKIYTLGQPVPEGAPVYQTESEATQDYPVLIKYALDENGKIVTAYVGAKGEDNHYYYFPHGPYEIQKEVIRSIYTPDHCIEGPVVPTMTFLAPVENHSYSYCYKNTKEWETTLDSMDKVEFISYNGYGCSIYNNQFLCQDVPSIDSFLGIAP